MHGLYKNISMIKGLYDDKVMFIKIWNFSVSSTGIVAFIWTRKQFLKNNKYFF